MSRAGLCRGRQLSQGEDEFYCQTKDLILYVCKFMVLSFKKRNEKVLLNRIAMFCGIIVKPYGLHSDSIYYSLFA